MGARIYIVAPSFVPWNLHLLAWIRAWGIDSARINPGGPVKRERGIDTPLLCNLILS